MNILITGGAGFIGQKLARALLQRGEARDTKGKLQAITRLRLFDVVQPRWGDDPRVQCIAGDIARLADVRAALGDETHSVIHTAAALSGESEANFDHGMRVNLDGTRALLEACRQLPAPPKFVFTSTSATFGGDLPDPVPDDWPQRPQGSYGSQKAMCELLINDMHRKGFIDARVPRLPTITVRPGKPNKAASSFASGIIREPLNGKESVVPVGSASRMWVLSPAQVVENLIKLHEATPDDFVRAGMTHTRALNMPGLCASVGEMYESLCDAGGAKAGALVKWERDPAIECLVDSWPVVFEAKAGKALGLRSDASFDEIVANYIRDELGGSLATK